MKLLVMTMMNLGILSTICAVKDGNLIKNLIMNVIEAEKKPYAFVLLGYKTQDLKILMEFVNEFGYSTAFISEPTLLHGYPQLDNIIFTIDVNTDKTLAFLKKAEELRLFWAPHRWFIFHGNNTIDFTIHKYLGNIDIPIMSGVNLIEIDILAEKIVAHRVYRINAQANIIVEYLGDWSAANTNYSKLLHFTVGETRANLNRMVLKTVVFITHNSTRYHLTDRREMHKDVHAKVDYIVLKLIAECINATIQFEIIQTNPNLRNDRHFLEYSFRKQVDIIGYGLVAYEKIIDHVNLIAPMGRSRLLLMFLQPQLSNLKNIYTLQFQPRVWYLLGLSLFTVWALGISIAKWEMKNFWSNDAVRISSLDIFFDIFCKICKQKSLDIYRSVTGNLLAAIFMFYILILTTSYSANIVSLLNSSPKPIKDFKDLVSAPFNIYMGQAGYDLYMLQNHSGPERQAVFRNKVVHKTIPTNDEGVRRIKNEGIGFLGNIDESSKCIETEFSEKEKCQLDYINMLSLYQAWLVLPKNSSLKEIIRMKVRKIAESGLKQREYHLMFSRKPECQKGKTFINVTWKDCSFLFLVMLIGITLSIVIFILEVLHSILHK